LLQDHLRSTLHRINTKTFKKEESEKLAFLQKMFELLGYNIHENLEFEYSTNTRSIDAVLGFLDPTGDNKNSRKVEVAIEWKGKDTKYLDKGKAGETPVSQMWDYMGKVGCEIGIVGNFNEWRIYTSRTKQNSHHEFILSELVGSNDKLDELIVLMNPKALLKGNNKLSLIEELIDQAQSEQEQITKKFYNDYKNLRLKLFHDIIEYNPDIPQLVILEKTQKLLDRLVFAMFCEDALLLPYEIIKTTYNLGKSSRSRSNTKIWEEFQYLFDDIDKGRHDAGLPSINAFNGGLFKTDEKLNSLIIQDSIWDEIIHLATYDFASDLNVNILGHIFEQSISDLEEIKAQIESIEIPLLQAGESKVSLRQEQPEGGDKVDGVDNLQTKPKPKTSKRKKDGIYYTPEYITDYIVEQTVGKFLEENPDSLETITVLDPAGGSGAFPNQVHSFLAKQHADIVNQKAVDAGLGAFAEFDEVLVDKSILKNNIFMVDIQPESVEIAKLSLWLKTARKDQKLDNLDSNIKCGNSLIDDKDIAGELAFDWNTEFPDIVPKGGFDVIVGNPPYVNIANIADSKARQYFQTNYKTVKNKSDLYSIFIERGINLLKDNGYLGFIVSNSWLGTDSFSEFRRFLIENTRVMKIVKMPPGVFDDATVTAMIIILRKEKVVGNHEIELVLCKDLEFQKMAHTLSYDRIRKTEGFTFSFEPKIEFSGVTVRLGDIAKFSLGIKTSNDERFILDKKIDEDCYPVLRGREIERYYAKKPEKWIWYKPKLMAEKVGSGARRLENFQCEKILFQTISGGIIKATIDSNNYLTNDKVHILYDVLEGWNMKCILGLVSSKFMENWIKSSFGNLLEIKINTLQQLPIPNATPEQQTEIADLVDKIMDLKVQYSKYLDNTFTLLEAELVGSSPLPPTINRTKNLTKFTELDFTTFLCELTKQKFTITPTLKRTLLETFEIDKAKLSELQNQINTVDAEIEARVRGLYGVE
jgi:type I restriction-modification system DNA methylase subunit